MGLNDPHLSGRNLEDSGLLDEYKRQIKMLKKKKKDDIENMNIEIIFLDAAEYLDNSGAVEYEKLTQAIKEHKPTLISLLFTIVNVPSLPRMGNVLRASGIFLLIQQYQIQYLYDKVLNMFSPVVHKLILHTKL